MPIPSRRGKAHYAFTRLLQKQPLDTEALWQEDRGRPRAYFLGYLKKGLSVVDDTTLDKPYAKKMELQPLIGAGRIKRGSKGPTFRP